MSRYYAAIAIMKMANAKGSGNDYTGGMCAARGAVWVLLGACALIPHALFAQALEQDDPNDGRYWGFSSQYQAEIDALGSTPVSMPIPVLLGVELHNLTDNFGDPRGGGTRTHEGLDIMAPSGTPIASPTDAVVLRTGNGVNSGLYVRTGNPGGENYVYMHLSAIAKGVVAGAKVKRGEILGYVGNTGNASGGGAHLHFEIRKNGALDPYPRLGEVFTLSERMAGVAQSLDRAANPEAHAKMLAKHFASTFSSAQTASLEISALVLSHMSPGASPAVAALFVAPASQSSLVFGETNADIRALQAALIASPQGSVGLRLKNTGATGYFGPLTREALIEYQGAMGLVASGAVDVATHAKLFGISTAVASAPAPALASASSSSTSSTTSSSTLSASIALFTRNLELGMTGEDVRTLQKFLNAKGFLIASSGVGSPGFESDYFGARTRAALIAYQKSGAIAPAIGFFGPLTRASLASR